MMDKLLVTRKEAAEALSISVDKLDQLRNSGLSKERRIGSRVYFTPEELKAFLKRGYVMC